MIAAAAFHAALGAIFTPAAQAAGFTRQGRRASNWQATLAGHALVLSFRVNPKVAGLPGAPGEFWPVIEWQGPRRDPGDDGTVSYYQYAADADLAEMQVLRRSVLPKLGAQSSPYLDILRQGLDLPLLPQSPHVALYYVDQADAGAWGGWFGSRIAAWRTRFEARPETLESWCRRVLWTK